jgi:hypothetical protein
MVVNMDDLSTLSRLTGLVREQAAQTGLQNAVLALAAALAAARGLDLALAQAVTLPRLDGINPAEADPRLLGGVYAALLSDKRERGAYYTPPAFARAVAHLLLPAEDYRLVPPLLCDPAVGGGSLLLAAGDVLAGRGITESAILDSLHGGDSDPFAVKLAGISLWLWRGDPGVQLHEIASHFRVGDSLLNPAWPDATFDAVIANPPYESVFSGAERKRYRTALQSAFVSASGSFDLATLFVERAIRLLKPGGRCALIVPNKLLSADYGRTLRRWAGGQGRIVALLEPEAERGDFPAGVYPVGIVFEKGEGDPGINVYRGWSPAGTPALIRRVSVSRSMTLPAESWSGPLHPRWEAISAGLVRTTPLEKVATVRAGLTVDEAYRLRKSVVESQGGSDGYRLVTSGAIRRYHSRWGTSSIRFLKASYQAPLIPQDALSVTRQAQARAPKLILSGLGKTPQCAFDPGVSLASVGTLIIYDSAWPLHALCAILNSAWTADLYWALFGGLALSGGYLRFGRRELEALPLPDLSPGDPRLATLATLGERRAQMESQTLDQGIDRLVEELHRPAATTQAGCDFHPPPACGHLPPF